MNYKWVYLKNLLEYEQEVKSYKDTQRFGSFDGEGWYLFKMTNHPRSISMYTVDERLEELQKHRNLIDRELYRTEQKKNNPKLGCAIKEVWSD